MKNMKMEEVGEKWPTFLFKINLVITLVNFSLSYQWFCYLNN